jgi:cysteinyl-tRNA synthetase
MVTVNGEKMSKSLGNFITIRELLNRGVDPMAVRLFVLTAQYRKPIDFTDEAIQAATNGWNTLKEGLLFGYQYRSQLGWDTNPSDKNANLDNETVERFKTSVDDDLNFPGGLAILFELAKSINRDRNLLVHQGKTETALPVLERQWHTLVSLANVLGLDVVIRGIANSTLPAPTMSASGRVGLSDAEIEAMIQQRQEARSAKNFTESDRIRNELQAKGITLIDSPDGTRWHRN